MNRWSAKVHGLIRTRSLEDRQSYSWGKRKAQRSCVLDTKCRITETLGKGSDQLVKGVCNFLGSVLPQQKFEVTDGPVLQPRVTAQFYLESKEKHILEAWGWVNPKDSRREAPSSVLAPLFLCFFLLPLSRPYLNWASQEGC